MPVSSRLGTGAKRGNDKRKTMMRKRNIFRYAAVWGSALLASVSCSTDDSDVYKTAKTDDAPVLFRAVQTVSEGDIQVNTRANNDYLLDEALWNFISNSSFKDKITRIRLRLAGTGEDGWDFSNNYYEYIYSKELEEKTRNSDDNKIYNFTPWTDNGEQYHGSVGPGMTWSQISSYMANGGSELYAALFAQTYDDTNSQTISPSQSTANDILNNDVLLSYHSVTDAELIDQYFKLKLFHVYSMFAVEVHIPIYDSRDGLGFEETQTENKTLRIDQSENLSQPLDVESPIEKLEVIDQQLHVVFAKQTVDGMPLVTVNSTEETKPQNVEMCLLAVSPPEPDESDTSYKIQKYLYACILPASSASAGTAANTPVRLTIKNRSSGVTETYICSLFRSPEGNTNAFTLQQGHITLACLTLARGANVPVLVTGKVLPWGTANAELGLVENGPGNEASRPTE